MAILPGGIPTAEAVGTPKAKGCIRSWKPWTWRTLVGQIRGAGGIASAEAFGTLELQSELRMIIGAGGIASAAAFGSPRVFVPASSIVWAASPSSVDINAAIALALDGDTVRVPAGNATWTGNVTVPSTKGVQVIGAGMGLTNIDLANTYQLYLDTRETNSRVRASGFSFNHGPTRALQINYRNNGAKNFRVDHIEWTNNAAIVAFIGGYTHGLIDNCYFNNQVRAIFIEGRCDNLDAYGDCGDYSWRQPVVMGGPQAVYIEDCYFNNTIAYPGQTIDCNSGGRYVLRHCTMRGWQGIETHSGCTPGYRNSRWVEIYENDLDVTPLSRWLGIWFRGCNGIAFNNAFTGNWTMPIQFDFEHACSRPAPCAGMWPLPDPLAEFWQYPVQDQIGAGQSSGAWGTPQDLNEAKLWIWANTLNGNPTTPQFNSCDLSASFIHQDRDYFLNAPPGYVPYTYPHPLTLL